MKSFFRYISICLLLISLLVYCKPKEQIILGDWEYVSLTIDTNKAQIWSFKEDNSIIRSLDTLKDTGTWLMEAARISGGKRLVVSGLSNLAVGAEANGTFEILTLNNKYLILQRILLSDGTAGGAFLRIEFVKKQ